MKTKLLIKSILLFIGLSLIAGCSDDMNGSKTAMNETALEHAKKHLDPTYVCPMHPSIVKDEPGSCPICGMDLVLKEQEQASMERKILYYRHPHNPTITSDKPMQDEMGMDYVPIYDDAGGVAVKISPAVVNNMGVRTAVVGRDKVWRRVETVAYVDFDEERIAHIHLRTKGWIDKLMVKSEGERVKKGDLLFELYSPELVAAQDEYLQALGTGNRRLIAASRERLVALGISDKQINVLKKERKVSQYVEIYATQDGIVANLNIREGMFVMPQQRVMSLADLSTVWLLAEVFEKQADWIRIGQPADITLSYLPGKTWEGKVEYIYPSLDPKTRTLKVRLRFDNPEELLKPNMFANVEIYAGPKADVTIVPREALIRVGSEQRVIMAKGEGRFEPRKVAAGIESGDWVEIKQGLQEGEIVVTSGQFLIDSEANLKASFQRMQSQDTPADTAIVVMGVIRNINGTTLTIEHDHVPSLQWPAMTTDFAAANDIELNSYKPGDQVMFELERTDKAYIIKSMHKHSH